MRRLSDIILFSIFILSCLSLGVVHIVASGNDLQNVNIDYGLKKKSSHLLNMPTVSHESGFYESPFDLLLAHEAADVTIYYTLDGSDPDPSNLKGAYFNYKNNYVQPQSSGLDGNLLKQDFRTHVYNKPILVLDRTSEPDRLSSISTTFDSEPDYFPVSRHTTGKVAKFLPKGTVLRAVAVNDKGQKSPVISRFFFIGSADEFKLPVINLTLPERDLFDYESGILVAGKDYDDWLKDESAVKRLLEYPWSWVANYKRNFKVKADIFIQNMHGMSLEAPIDIKVHGGATRSHRLKSLRIYPDKSKPIYFDLFEDGHYVEKNRFILRAAGNAAGGTYLTDAAVHKISQGLNFGVQRYAPYIVFVNGEYYGILNARDRRDAYYLKSLYSLPSKKIDHLKNNEELVSGSVDAWRDFIVFLQTAEPQSSEFYTKMERYIDVLSFIDYQAAHILIADKDWPQNNIAYWRYKVESDKSSTKAGYADGRWRWFMYDTDFLGSGMNRRDEGISGYKLNDNMLEWATSIENKEWQWSTYVLRRLLENDQFRDEFIVRFADLLNSWYEPKRSTSIIMQMKERLQSDMPEHIHRWGRPASMEHWANEVTRLSNYFEERPEYQRQHLADFFSLPGTYTVKVVLSEHGSASIKLNSLVLKASENPLPSAVENVLALPWSGEYFKGMPLRVEATPLDGYEFSHWEILGADVSNFDRHQKILVVQPDANIYIKAVTTKASGGGPRRVFDSLSLQHELGFDFILSSSGYIYDKSYAQVEGVSIQSVSRGLSLVGLTSDGRVNTLRTVDLCGEPLHAGHGFKQDLEQYQTDYAVMAIIAHDSAICTDERKSLNVLFSDTGLDMWKQISFRTPYIAIISQGGKRNEFAGNRGDVLMLHVKDESSLKTIVH